MATEFNTRIKHKRDTSANWTSADPVLLNGEIIIVDTAGGSVRTKTGDGVKKYSQLPFDDEEIYSAISEKAVATETIAATLTAAGWVDMVQTVSNSAIKAGQNGIVGLSPSATAAQISAAKSAGLVVSAQAEGSVTVKYEGSEPSVDIPIQIMLFG